MDPHDNTWKKITLRRNSHFSIKLAKGNKMKSPTHRFKGEWSVAAGRIEQVVQVLVGPIRPLVTVAVRDGEDAEDEDDVDDQFIEDALS